MYEPFINKSGTAQDIGLSSLTVIVEPEDFLLHGKIVSVLSQQVFRKKISADAAVSMRSLKNIGGKRR